MTKSFNHFFQNFWSVPLSRLNAFFQVLKCSFSSFFCTSIFMRPFPRIVPLYPYFWSFTRFLSVLHWSHNVSFWTQYDPFALFAWTYWIQSTFQPVLHPLLQTSVTSIAFDTAEMTHQWNYFLIIWMNWSLISIRSAKQKIQLLVFSILFNHFTLWPTFGLISMTFPFDT